MLKNLCFGLLIAGTALAADPDFIPPLDALNEKGALVLTDGSSVFEFRRGGVFASYPVGMSGRVFDGTWTTDESGPFLFKATATEKWMNGSQPLDNRYRIAFHVSSGRWIPADMLPFKQHPEVFKCYFFIDELVCTWKAPKPKPWEPRPPPPAGAFPGPGATNKP